MKKQLVLTVTMILVSSLNCAAETYRWTDSSGVMHFSDNLESVPVAYRKKVKISDDITISDPRIREELQQQEQRAREEEASRPNIVTTPDYVPPSPPLATPDTTIKAEPPPRTKSQKIRDNLERRRLEEERAKSSGQSQQ
jgi:hypothetical protein